VKYKRTQKHICI